MKVSAQSSDGSKISITLFLAHRSHKRSIPQYFFFRYLIAHFIWAKHACFMTFWTYCDAHILLVELK